MKVWLINCRWPQDAAAGGLDGVEVDWTGGTETGVGLTRVVTLITQSHLAGAFAVLQAMWVAPVVGASRQKTDQMKRVWSMTGDKISKYSLICCSLESTVSCTLDDKLIRAYLNTEPLPSSRGSVIWYRNYGASTRLSATSFSSV